jgi:serine/threonine-protein kinase Chk2
MESDSNATLDGLTQEPCGTSVFNNNDDEWNVWGLLKRNGSDDEFKLIHHNNTDGRDAYSIGRHPHCNIVVDDNRVSSVHCLIYCEYDDDRLQMFVENRSSNGTFVNNSLTRLSKSEKTELKSGYEIYLMNPHFVSKDQGGVSYTFINMRERMFALKKVEVPNSLHPRSQLSNNTSRHIEHYYVIGDTIGSGMCGQVHMCTNIFTKKQFAVKVIDVKKYARTPGLSRTELMKEADLMRELSHVSLPHIICHIFTDYSYTYIYIIII